MKIINILSADFSSLVKNLDLNSDLNEDTDSDEETINADSANTSDIIDKSTILTSDSSEFYTSMLSTSKKTSELKSNDVNNMSAAQLQNDLFIENELFTESYDELYRKFSAESQ